MTDTIAIASAIPDDLARMIGALPQLAGSDGDAPEPETMLDWALWWAVRGVHVFPCKSFLGIPVMPKWYSAASISTGQLAEWWSARPDADIGAVPELSGHFVISAVGQEGQASFDALEEKYGKTLVPEFMTMTRWNTVQYWFKGRALSSHNKLGPGLHVHGAGTYLYMPASMAPLGIE